MTAGHAKKALLVVAGSVSLALGVAGIFLPVLPTTPLLLLAAWCYLRSSERLHKRLLGSRVLGPYIRNYMEFRAVSGSVKVFTLVFLWLTLALSMLLVPNLYVRILLALVGAAVTVHVLTLKTLAPENMHGIGAGEGSPVRLTGGEPAARAGLPVVESLHREVHMDDVGMEDGGGQGRVEAGAGGRRGVAVTGGKAAFPISVLALSILTVLALFLTVKPGLSILAMALACLLALVVFLSVLARRRVSRYLLYGYLVLVCGVALFYVAFGVEPFFKNLLLNGLFALPAVAVSTLILVSGRWKKPGAVALPLALCAALFILSIVLFLGMNLRIRPRVASLQAGHDRYLASLRKLDVPESPNVLVVLTDDLGYGDLAVYGNETIDTPAIDRLAAGGVVMESFYSASPVCTPSRFSLMTGRYDVRGNLDEVLMPTVKSFRPFNYARAWNPVVIGKGVDGILPDEITVAEALQSAGYATGAFGKWHLGDYGGYLPNANGFDYFYGSYYSNDMVPYEFYRNEKLVIEHPVDQAGITRDLTDEVISFIDENRDERFFVYYATPWPHHPLYASDGFQGSSAAGTYGDCLQELDAGLGEIIATLEEHGLLDSTLVIFTSDNGPWHQGGTGGLRGRKGNALEGGQKVPFIAHYPPALAPGSRVAGPAMNIDLFPTILALCGLPPPRDRVIDGIDILPLLSEAEGARTHDALFYSKSGGIRGVRSGGFKYFDRVRSENSTYILSMYRELLFDLENDPAESYDVKDLHPGIAEELRKKLLEFRERLDENPRGILEE